MKYNIIRFLPLMFSIIVSAQNGTEQTLIINEVQVANLDQFLDNSNCYGSWIELYNPTPASISLAGMYISDGVNDFRIQSAQGSIPANGFKTF